MYGLLIDTWSFWRGVESGCESQGTALLRRMQCGGSFGPRDLRILRSSLQFSFHPSGMQNLLVQYKPNSIFLDSILDLIQKLRTTTHNVVSANPAPAAVPHLTAGSSHEKSNCIRCRKEQSYPFQPVWDQLHCELHIHVKYLYLTVVD